MRVVLDTNIVIAGLLWTGKPRQLLDSAIDGKLALYTSEALLVELERALGYKSVAKQLSKYETTVQQLTEWYRQLTQVVVPKLPSPTVSRDVDDDQVIGSATASGAQLIVTGDKDLLVLVRYERTLIVTPAEALQVIAKLS